MSDTVTTPQRISETTPLLATLNKGYMVQWINNDLLNRAANDVRHSTVLYDAEFDFVAALPAAMEVRADVWAALYDVGVRYWSRGIV